MNIQEINFKPLFQWIKLTLGTDGDFFISFEGKRPRIVNENYLYAVSGIFKAVVKEVSIDFFNFEFNPETTKLWGTVYLNYESWSGGSNGMQIGTCWYSEASGWTFESSKERFQKYNQQ